MPGRMTKRGTVFIFPFVPFLLLNKPPSTREEAKRRKKKTGRVPPSKGDGRPRPLRQFLFYLFLLSFPGFRVPIQADTTTTTPTGTTGDGRAGQTPFFTDDIFSACCAFS